VIFLKNFELSLADNINTIETLFSGDSILRKRQFSFLGISACLFYFDGMVNVELINESIIKPLSSLQTCGRSFSGSALRSAGEFIFWSKGYFVKSIIS
jgi:hypothetical protein